MEHDGMPEGGPDEEAGLDRSETKLRQRVIERRQIAEEGGVDRVVGATNWLRANGKLGVLGEFAGGPNSQCLSAVTGLLDHLKANSDVWQGAMWWAAGPWWPASTYSSFEPPSGTAYQYYDSLLKKYVPA